MNILSIIGASSICLMYMLMISDNNYLITENVLQLYTYKKDYYVVEGILVRMLAFCKQNLNKLKFPFKTSFYYKPDLIQYKVNCEIEELQQNKYDKNFAIKTIIYTDNKLIGSMFCDLKVLENNDLYINSWKFSRSLF